MESKFTFLNGIIALPFMNIRGFLGEMETTKAYIVDTIIGKIGAICDHPLEIVVEVSSFLLLLKERRW